MKQIRKLFFFMILFIVFCFNQAIGKDLLVQNATMIDGTGNPPQENISILIRQGKIIRIGQDIEAEGIRRLDVKGFDKKLLFYRLSIRSEKYTVKEKNMAGGGGKEGVF